MPLQTDSPALLDFHKRPAPVDNRQRLAAALLTLIPCALFVMLIWRSFVALPVKPATLEFIASISPDAAPKKIAPMPPPPLPFIAARIHTKAQDAAFPNFTIQPERPPSQATLPVVSHASASPLAAGMPNTHDTGQPVGASGTNGDAGASSGCLDADWVRAVNARFLGAVHYPRRAEMLGITGEVRLRFTVKSDGFFSTLKVDKASGFYSLDSNVIDMLKRAQPLPAIPSRMHVARVNGELVLLFGRNLAGSATPLLTCN